MRYYGTIIDNNDVTTKLYVDTEVANAEVYTYDHSILNNLDDDDHTQYALLSGRSGDTLFIDTINEHTTSAGVTIDNILIKDGNVDGRDLSIDGSKLDGIEELAEVNNISDTNAGLLTGGTNTTLHYHSSDRDWNNLSNVPSDISNISSLLVNKDYIQFNTSITPNPTYSEGLLFYDSTKHALSYYNEESDVTVNLGVETLIRVKNNTGSTITNGSVVYPNGVDGGAVTVALARADSLNTCALVGVVTHDIENGSFGYVTKTGEVADIDTTGFSTGTILYLSATIDGKITDIYPTDGEFPVIIGAVKNVDESGSIVVDITNSQITVEANNTFGFPAAQRNATTLSFDNTTKTFTLGLDTGETVFHYYFEGHKYEKTADVSKQITETDSGLYVFYFDDGVMDYAVSPTDVELEILIKTKTLIGCVYWNQTESKYIFIGDKRHSIGISPETHSYLHFVSGSQYLYGLALNNIDIGNGSLDAHAQYGIDAGTITDAGLVHTINAVTNTTGVPVCYMNDVSGTWSCESNSGFSVLNNSVTGRLDWNEWDGSTWKRTSAANNYYVLYHVLATNNYNSSPIVVMGQSQHLLINNAREAAASELNILLSKLPMKEVVPVATLIFKTRDSFTNSVKASIVELEDGSEYIDWRLLTPSGGASPSNHSLLSNLSVDDHKQYALLSGRSGDTLKIDDVIEYTTDAGVTIEGTVLKDGDVIINGNVTVTGMVTVTSDVIAEKAGVFGYDLTNTNTITTESTYQSISDTLTYSELHGFSNVNNVLTYTLTPTRVCLIQWNASANVDRVGAEISLVLFKNGSEQTASLSQIQSHFAYGNLGMSGMMVTSLSTNDTLELKITSNGTGDIVQTSNLQFMVKEFYT